MIDSLQTANINNVLIILNSILKFQINNTYLGIYANIAKYDHIYVET